MLTLDCYLTQNFLRAVSQTKIKKYFSVSWPNDFVVVVVQFVVVVFFVLFCWIFESKLA